MRRWVLIIGVLILAGVLFSWVNAHYKMVDMSSLEVTVAPPLSLDSVRVKRGFYSINRANDLVLFSGMVNDRFVYDGRQVGSLDTDYGENDFLITYGDRSYLQFRHFIFNSNHQHDYTFAIEQRQDSLYLTVDIEGPDAMRFTRPMNHISEAAQRSCNGSIDSAKVIYNMIELE